MTERATYWRINKTTGESEEVDTFTNEIVSKTKAYTTLDLELKKYEVTPGVIFQIAKLVTSGKTLKHIADMEGMPPLHILYAWKRNSDDFRTMVQEAEKDRAEIFHGKIMDAVDEIRTVDKSDIPGLKLYVDTLKYLAESDNPEKFKAKGKDEENRGSVTIQVNTGIDRTVDSNTGMSDNVEVTDYKEVENGKVHKDQEQD